MYALAACCVGLALSPRQKVCGCGELTMTSRCISPGCRLARPQASAPPQSCATSAARLPPAPHSWAISAAMSAFRCLAR